MVAYNVIKHAMVGEVVVVHKTGVFVYALSS